MCFYFSPIVDYFEGMKSPTIYGTKIVIYGKKRLPFVELSGLAIQMENRLWIFDGKKLKDGSIRFKRVTLPGWIGRTSWKETRKRYFGTQANAAKALGLSQSFISKVERGDREFPMEAWANYLEDLKRKKEEQEILDEMMGEVD